MKKKAPTNSIWKEILLPLTYGFLAVLLLFFALKYLKRSEQLPGINLILSPHLDDATLSLGGFMAESKTPVVVVTFFAGKPQTAVNSGWDKISGFIDSDEAVTSRIEENIKALKQEGAHPLNLGYIDFQYESDKEASYRQKNILLIEHDIETILREFRNSKQLSIYGPSEFGSKITHPDHKLLHDAFTNVAKRVRIGDKIHFYFYEDFPYVKRYELSNNISLKSFLERENEGVSLKEWPIEIPTSSLDKKVDAINTYESQDKAFATFGDNISASAREYARKRCSVLIPKPYACEVVYEIEK
ncbi:MAG: hypothetical protein EXS59_00700 [Candidatus Taylorbacteria bacterium]|nr:hypothetical protein [Candidatus Taylorbacteria bacterium]